MEVYLELFDFYSGQLDYLGQQRRPFKVKEVKQKFRSNESSRSLVSMQVGPERNIEYL